MTLVGDLIERWFPEIKEVTAIDELIVLTNIDGSKTTKTAYDFLFVFLPNELVSRYNKSRGELPKLYVANILLNICKAIEYNNAVEYLHNEFVVDSTTRNLIHEGYIFKNSPDIFSWIIEKVKEM